MQLLTRPFKQLYERVYITIIRYIFPTIRIEGRIVHTAQKMKSSIKDFLRVSCGFGYTYWRHLWWKTFAQWRMYIDLKRCLELIKNKVGVKTESVFQKSTLCTQTKRTAIPLQICFFALYLVKWTNNILGT